VKGCLYYRRFRPHPNLSTTTAHEGFFATYCFTVGDQDKSKDFYVRILGGKVIKPDNPCYMARQKSALFYRAIRQSRLGMALLRA
jgi:hypothetical protein